MPMKYPAHPGRIIQTNLKALRLSVEETAPQLDITPEQLARVINGEASITHDLATRLGDLFACGADIWRRMQAAYDEAQERNRHDAPEEMEPLSIHQQKATVPLQHGRVIYTTYDAEVIALRVVPSQDPRLSGNPNHDRVEFRFVGEGLGVVRIQMIYQPAEDSVPRLVADVVFKAYLKWDEESDEYVGRFDAAEWNRESQKLDDGKEIMNALYAGLQNRSSVPVFKEEDSVESGSEGQARVLREAEALLNKPTKPVSAEELSAVLRRPP